MMHTKKIISYLLMGICFVLAQNNCNTYIAVNLGSKCPNNLSPWYNCVCSGVGTDQLSCPSKCCRSTLPPSGTNGCAANGDEPVTTPTPTPFGAVVGIVPQKQPNACPTYKCPDGFEVNDDLYCAFLPVVNQPGVRRLTQASDCRPEECCKEESSYLLFGLLFTLLGLWILYIILWVRRNKQKTNAVEQQDRLSLLVEGGQFEMRQKKQSYKPQALVALEQANARLTRQTSNVDDEHHQPRGTRMGSNALSVGDRPEQSLPMVGRGLVLAGQSPIHQGIPVGRGIATAEDRESDVELQRAIKASMATGNTQPRQSVKPRQSQDEMDKAVALSLVDAGLNIQYGKVNPNETKTNERQGVKLPAIDTIWECPKCQHNNRKDQNKAETKCEKCKSEYWLCKSCTLYNDDIDAGDCEACGHERDVMFGEVVN